jgi:DNA-binding MarR family transcriptional regulator
MSEELVDAWVGQNDESVIAMLVSLRRLHLAHARLRSHAARDLGLSLIELNTLTFAVERLGITPKDLAYELGLTTGSVTALADRLEVAGLLRRDRHSCDRRSVVLNVTAEGSAAVTSVVSRFSEPVVAMMTRTNDTKLAHFAELLASFSEAILEEAETPGNFPRALGSTSEPVGSAA